MAAARGVPDGDGVNFKPEKFGYQGRRGGQQAARLGLESESGLPTGIWRFKARGGLVVAFDRVEPGLKAGPLFWKDSGGNEFCDKPSARVVKPGTRYDESGGGGTGSRSSGH
jgi:hypothetical protein